jgi:hypothetical protein
MIQRLDEYGDGPGASCFWYSPTAASVSTYQGVSVQAANELVVVVEEEEEGGQ